MISRSCVLAFSVPSFLGYYGLSVSWSRVFSFLGSCNVIFLRFLVLTSFRDLVFLRSRFLEVFKSYSILRGLVIACSCCLSLLLSRFLVVFESRGIGFERSLEFPSLVFSLCEVLGVLGSRSVRVSLSRVPAFLASCDYESCCF